jgi:RNA polymerase primary sigma factor
MSTATSLDLSSPVFHPAPSRPAPVPVPGKPRPRSHAEQLRDARDALSSLLRQLPSALRAQVVAGTGKVDRRRRSADPYDWLAGACQRLEHCSAAQEDPAVRRIVSQARRLRRRIECSREQLVLANLHLVPQAVRCFRAGSVPFGDLVQEGHVGLMQAVDRFDPTRGFRFSTYAVWWIRRAVFEAFGQRSRLIRLPDSLRADLRRLRRTQNELEDRLGRRPDPVEIAERMNVPLKKVRKLIGITPEPTPIEDLTQGGDALGRTLGPDPLERALTRELRVHAREALRLLDPRERKILRLRFGFDDGEDRTLEEVGRLLGLSRERVRQIEREALGKIRVWAAERGLGTA